MYDIIIVGGGPAGAMAGKYLSSSGKNVLIFQKDLSFKKPCGGGIRIDAFDEFHINKNLIKNVVNEIVFETRYKCIEFDLSHVPLAIVDRVEFDESLRNDAKNAGATIIEAKVTDIEVLDSKVVVDAQIEGINRRYEANYLIAADGVLSIVRKKIRNESVPKLLTNYSDIDSVLTTKCHFYFGSPLASGAYSWRFPHKIGSDIGTVSYKNTKKYIDNLCTYLKLNQNVKVRGYNIPKWEKPIFNDERVFYVGDAAGQVLPFTYEGIYYAMKSAKILSSVFIEDVDAIEYENRWNKLYYKKFKELKTAQRLFLANDLTVLIMMKILDNKKIQNKVLDIWMGREEIEINRHFLYRIFLQLFK
jgi:geranylgeranyl reductase